MTYEKAIDALIATGYLTQTDQVRALSALSSTRTEFTYPAWAQALVDAGLISPSDAPAAADAMQQAAHNLEETENKDDLDQNLENAGIL